jgi:cell division septum initiation protein DivIVA
MSVFEPQMDPDPDDSSQLPVLEVPLRGRKGQQVSAYIDELAMRLDQQRIRATQAEQAAAHLHHELEALRHQPPPSFEHLGSEAAKVLEDAGRSAKVLVREATDRGKAIVVKAEEVGGQIRGRAEHDAQTRLDAARQAAEQMLAKANAQRSSIEAEVKRLREYRDGLLNHLGRVEADLARFLSEVSDPPPAPRAQPAPAEAGAAPGPKPEPEAGATPGPKPEPEAEATPGPKPEPEAEAAPTDTGRAEPEPAPAQDSPAAQAEPDRAPAAPSRQPAAESAIAAARAPR